jgi:hypothetical protein
VKEGYLPFGPYFRLVLDLYTNRLFFFNIEKIDEVFLVSDLGNRLFASFCLLRLGLFRRERQAESDDFIYKW